MNKKYFLAFLTLHLLFAQSHTALGEPFEFALIGDLPYGVKIDERDEDTSQLIQTLNSETSLSWVLHIGDIKTGKSSCSNRFLMNRYQRFSEIQHPFIYTPGDNEWTDCHNPLAGSYDPLERLDFIRELFFENKKTLGVLNKLNISTQSRQQIEHGDYVENYSWKKDGVHFATIHMVGSLDGTKSFSVLSKIKRTKKHDQAVRSRQKAAIDWLRFSFEKAKKENAKALFIAFHANPGWDHRWEKENRPVFRYFTRVLKNEMNSFNKPVVVAHGDTHTFRIDKPSINGKSKAPSNFTRIESFGENNNAWIKVRVEPDSASVFSYEVHDQQ